MTPESLRIFPIVLKVGDRFRDEEGVWEIAGHPFTTRDGKVVHATIQKPGDPASAKEKTWGAHERLTIERAAAPAVSKVRDRSKPRSTRARARRQK